MLPPRKSSERARVLAAMSGGVDSSVAAARLVGAGYEVIGVTLHLWDYPDDAPEKTRCCAPEDAHDARLTADCLGIPHYTFDRRELFAQEVVGPFVEAYLAGHTPSPCVWCNRSVKMAELLAVADRLGARYVATGHYARVERDEGGVARLYRARARGKDQSYFLHMLTAAQLDRVLLPLGDALKDEVRAEARARGLPRADKGESQELCFVPQGSYAQFVEERTGGRVRPGPIVDAAGRSLGTHGGVHRFTVGQRRGLGVALGRPAFVTAIDAAAGQVTVGDESELGTDIAVLADEVHADDVTFPLEASVQVRARHDAAPARLAYETRSGERRLVVRFTQPVRAIAPGQVAVAYRGDRVLAGGTITSAERSEPYASPARAASGAPA